MGNIDQNQFQSLNTNCEPRALQENAIVGNDTTPNRESQTRHPSSTYTDDEKRCLVISADKKRGKDTGFMLRLKRKWDKQYPGKNHVSKQNVKDKAARFKKLRDERWK